VPHTRGDLFHERTLLSEGDRHDRERVGLEREVAERMVGDPAAA
jgi:hypothetical protein